MDEGQRTRLCLTCGTVSAHASDCPQAPPAARTPAERSARVQAALREAEARVAEIDAAAKTDARRAVYLALEAEDLLERHPAADLTSFEEKRAHNALATKLAGTREELARAIPDERGARLVADFRFAKRAVELLFQLALRRHDAWDFDVQALVSLPEPIQRAADSGASLKDICAEVDARAKAGTALDAEVESWGWANLTALTAGGEPFHVPDAVLGARGMTARLGRLVGRGASREAEARERFAALSGRFRERLYLLGANAILWRVTSRLAQAEEAWKRHTARDDGPRWARIEREDADLVRFLADGLDVASGVEKALARVVRTSPALLRGTLRPFAELGADEWDVFARAYFFERGAVLDDSESAEVGMEPIARALLQRRRDRPVNQQEIAELTQEVRELWKRKPPRETRKEKT